MHRSSQAHAEQERAQTAAASGYCPFSSFSENIWIVKHVLELFKIGDVQPITLDDL